MKISIDYLFLSNIYFYNKDDITSGKWFYCRCKTLQTCRKLKIYLDDNIDNLIYIGKNVKDQLFFKKMGQCDIKQVWHSLHMIMS